MHRFTALWLVALLPGLAACGDDSIAPQVSGLEATANLDNVLSAFVNLNTDVPTTAVAEVFQQDTRELLFRSEPSALGTSHELFVMNFRAETDVDIVVTATGEGGGASSTTVPFTVGSLPDDFPPLDVAVNDTASMAPGYTIFDVRRWNPALDNEYGYIMVLDETGAPRWYFRPPDGRPQDVNVGPNGNVFYGVDNQYIREIDWAGNTLNNWTPEDIGVVTFHHEFGFLPNGNLFTLGIAVENRGPYTREDEEVFIDVVADTIVEFQPDGTLVREIDFFDLLDPLTDTTPLFNNPFWNNFLADEYPDGTADWTHGNAIIYDMSDDSFIVSLRHVHALVKVSRTGDLIWRLGPGPNGSFTLGGEDDEFNYAQHSPMITASNRIILYDNGNLRPVTEGESRFTRVVEFELDLEAMTATEVFEYRGEETYNSIVLGDADFLGDSVLIGDGGLLADPTAGIQNPDNQKSCRFREVTYGDTPEVVFELNITDTTSAEPIGYSCYRADRITSFTPVGG
ncbi:MAG: aryl-sulfate sulfotransferase [Myxococcota bacterium]